MPSSIVTTITTTLVIIPILAVAMDLDHSPRGVKMDVTIHTDPCLSRLRDPRASHLLLILCPTARAVTMVRMFRLGLHLKIP